MSEVRILPAAPLHHVVMNSSSKEGIQDDPARVTEDEGFMREALVLGAQAARAGEVPVGCVMVHGGEVIARAHNLREHTQDPTAHAEILAIRHVAAQLGSFRLIGVTCYVTLEPCPMCAGALVNSRVARVVYGCADPKAGAVHSLDSIGVDARFNHRFEAQAGVLAGACAAQLKGFFEALRAERRALRETRD
jgi:tRNA(adenine34) deaminase